MNELNSMKALLSVVDPAYPNIISSDELTRGNLLKSTIKLAEKNGLYYYFIHSLKEQGVNLQPSEEYPLVWVCFFPAWLIVLY